MLLHSSMSTLKDRSQGTKQKRVGGGGGERETEREGGGGGESNYYSFIHI